MFYQTLRTVSKTERDLSDSVIITYNSLVNLIGYLPMNDVVAMEIGHAWQQLLSITSEHGFS